MEIIDEIVAIETFIHAQFPTSATGKQIVPNNPKVDTFYIRFASEKRETETRYHVRADREYQIVYVAEWPETAIPKMEALAKALYQTETISGGIRVESFSFTQPVELEGGGYAAIGILSTVVRKPRDQAVSSIIQNVGIRED